MKKATVLLVFVLALLLAPAKSEAGPIAASSKAIAKASLASIKGVAKAGEFSIVKPSVYVASHPLKSIRQSIGQPILVTGEALQEIGSVLSIFGKILIGGEQSKPAPAPADPAPVPQSSSKLGTCGEEDLYARAEAAR